MASLSDQGREYAQGNEPVRLLPVDVTTWKSIATSQAFGPFNPGDWVIITSDVAAHVNAGGSGTGGDTTAAATTNPQFPAGAQDWVVPDGCTHVHLLGASAGNGCVFKAG